MTKIIIAICLFLKLKPHKLLANDNLNSVSQFLEMHYFGKCKRVFLKDIYFFGTTKN